MSGASEHRVIIIPPLPPQHGPGDPEKLLNELEENRAAVGS